MSVIGDTTGVEVALGYSPKTIETHATASGADYARYVAVVLAGDG